MNKLFANLTDANKRLKEENAVYRTRFLKRIILYFPILASEPVINFFKK